MLGAAPSEPARHAILRSIAGVERAAHHPVFDPDKAEARGTNDDQCPGQSLGHGSNHAWLSARADRRSKILRLTKAGAARLRAARAGWTQAQAKFEAAFGGRRAAGLRALLQAVTATDLGAVPSGARD